MRPQGSTRGQPYRQAAVRVQQLRLTICEILVLSIYKTGREIIRLALMLYVRFALSPSNVEDLLHERGFDSKPK